MTLLELLPRILQGEVAFLPSWREAHVNAEHGPWAFDRLYVGATARGELTLIREQEDCVEHDAFTPGEFELTNATWEIDSNPSFLSS